MPEHKITQVRQICTSSRIVVVCVSALEAEDLPLLKRILSLDALAGCGGDS